MKQIRQMSVLCLALLIAVTSVLAAETTQVSESDLVLMGIPVAGQKSAEAVAPADATEAQDPVEDAEDWKLLLVNPWNKLPEDYTIQKKQLLNGLYVDERIYDDLNAMLTDCRKAGLQPVVCSAYRSNSTQTRLHNNKIARLRYAGYSYEAAVKEAGRWVAAPGTSEHETGLALDLVSYKYQLLNSRQENTEEQKWLMEHSWEYGFILRYPSDKTEVTGIGYEPWHYRYVGRDHAAKIHESGLCLEEYLESLKAEPVTAVETAAASETAAAEKPATAAAVTRSSK